MEGRIQTVHRDGIGGKEIPKRGVDQKIPLLLGSAVKRKRLSDITNTVSSSRVASSSAQFQENPKEVACGITKDCITQLMEENTTLLKALGERNKIIELSSIEMQKLRFTLEKTSQQNRMLAQANSQMLAELTSSKERLKALQHELGCTVAVLRLKNSELDVKDKLNKELIEKNRIEEGSKVVATDVRQAQSFSICIACRLDRNSQLNEEKLKNGPCEKTRVEENSKDAEIATGVSLSHSVSDSMACIPNTKRTLRSKILRSTTSTHQAEERSNHQSSEKIRIEEESLNRELCEKNTAEEEHSECAEVATDALQSDAVDNSLACEPNRKRILRSRSLGVAATVTHQVEEKEKDARRKSSRRRSDNRISKASESKDSLLEIVDAQIPSCSVITELPCEGNNPARDESSATLTHEVEVKEKDDARRRKSSRRKPVSLKSEPCESKHCIPETADMKNPACSPITEPPNEDNPVQEETLGPSTSHTSVEHEEDKAQKDQSISSHCQGQETCRTSVGRPTRKAAEKVSSYKEVPLNIKMRRS